MLSSVRELQQDVRELNQADFPEVDPEENSAEFMGILIKVAYTNVSQHNTRAVRYLYVLHPPCVFRLSFQSEQVI